MCGEKPSERKGEKSSETLNRLAVRIILYGLIGQNQWIFEAIS